MCVTRVCVCLYVLYSSSQGQGTDGQVSFYIVIFSLVHSYIKDIALWGPSFEQRASYWVPFLGFVS